MTGGKKGENTGGGSLTNFKNIERRGLKETTVLDPEKVFYVPPFTYRSLPPFPPNQFVRVPHILYRVIGPKKEGKGARDRNLRWSSSTLFWRSWHPRGVEGGDMFCSVSSSKKTSSPTPFLLTANSKKHSTFAQRFAKLMFSEISQNRNFTGHRQNSALPYNASGISALKYGGKTFCKNKEQQQHSFFSAAPSIVSSSSLFFPFFAWRNSLAFLPLFISRRAKKCGFGLVPWRGRP